ncbi:unnamed protein product [Candidula unifasciata]|uniref:Carbohydrate sulfotransferase n=1 Tax=Candidula unifasciata TaxID=100452 RepID=A0A8S3Z6D8_9EUPU|nr:unnamed protein product [Candidula unifasciata]
MFKSMVTVAKVTLVFLNIWVLAVVLVVSLGHWRVFESNDLSSNFDDSHFVVMRELQEEENRKPGPVGSNLSNSFNFNPFAQLSPAAPIEQRLRLVNHNHRPSRAPAHDSTPSPAQASADLRVRNLRHLCQQQHPHKTLHEHIPKTKLSSILVEEKHKLLFCQIPGVAINEWRKIILILSGIVNATSTGAISGGDVYGKYAKNSKRLSDYGDKERSEMLKSYYKVIFVRDPLERLVIAYRTKLLSKGSKYFHRAFGSPIIKKYRQNATDFDIKQGTNVLFPEFVKFIIDNEHEGAIALNEHWEQYYKQCHPCLVDYDFVGTFEDVEKDIKLVLDKLTIKPEIKPPYVTDTKMLSQSELRQVYGDIRAYELNNLFKVYSPDYTLFGYQCPSFIHELLQQGNIFHDY